MPRLLALTGITAHTQKHFTSSDKTQKELRQVNTLDEGFKLSQTGKIFHCCWQAIPNFNNAVSKKILSTIHTTATNKQFTNMSTCCFIWTDKEKLKAIRSTKPKIIL